MFLHKSERLLKAKVVAHLDKIEYEKKERKERKVRIEEDKKEFNGKAGYFRKCMRAKNIEKQRRVVRDI